MNGREITFILIIVICFEMGKPFLLLYFSAAETRECVMEKCPHGRTGAKTGQDRAALGEKWGSRCWHKQQEQSPLATQRSPFQLFPHLSTGPIWIEHLSLPHVQPYGWHKPHFLRLAVMLLIWHSVLWLSLDMMDTHPSVWGDTQQSLVIDEPVLFQRTADEMLQERTRHVSFRHLQWLYGSS